MQALTDLTWDDLRQWAGSKILSRGKTYVKNVHDLARGENGELIAWVSGSKRYATSVQQDEDGELDSFCTCPYDREPCKHAVAVVLAGAERMKQGQEIPPADTKSAVYQALSGESDEDDWDEDDADEEEKEPGMTHNPATGGKTSPVAKILQQKSKEELLNLLIDVAGRHPEVKRRILEDDQLKSGKIVKLVSALRQEIIHVASEPAWHDSWKNEGNLPDYSHIQEQLSALLEKGYADAVLELGQELWKRGNAQVEQSDDDGDTAMEIQQCLEIVFRALPSSSLPPPEQLLRMIDIFLEDQFSISDSCGRFIENKAYQKGHWAVVAQRLAERLDTKPAPKGDSFSDRYQRSRLMDWLIEAYERSGQGEEVLPLLEKEAHKTQCYGRIVEALLQAGQSEKARQWCIAGFEKTAKDAPGIAGNLQKKLRELAQAEKKFELAAAYRAQDFFEQPSRNHYMELKEAAEKIKSWPDIRAAALHYLETGLRPDVPSKKAQKLAWPLPRPKVMEKPDNRFRRQYPDLDTLIDIAIFEKRLDDVVALYHSQQKTLRWGHGKGVEVAQAVAGTHPDIALGIWKKLAESQIRLVKPKAYDEAAIYLGKMFKVYQKTQRLSEWQNFLRALRFEHKAKRRLLEVLDALERVRIID